MLSRTLAGDDVDQARDELERLYSAHAKAVFGYAFRRVSRAEAEEIVAETFLTAWRRRDAVTDDALPWLLGVARRVLLNQRRSANRRAALLAKLTDALRHSARLQSDPQTPPQLREAIVAALESLSGREREALMLRLWDNLDLASAAKVAGCSERVLSARFYRGRKRLERELIRSGFNFAGEGAVDARTEEAKD